MWAKASEVRPGLFSVEPGYFLPCFERPSELSLILLCEKYRVASCSSSIPSSCCIISSCSLVSLVSIHLVEAFLQGSEV